MNTGGKQTGGNSKQVANAMQKKKLELTRHG